MYDRVYHPGENRTYAPEEIVGALDRRTELLAAQALSLPAGEGKLAILVGTCNNLEGEDPDEVGIVTREGRHIADSEMAKGVAVELIIDATYSDANAVIADPSFSDVCVIGGGSFNRVYVRNDSGHTNRYGSTNNSYDWMDVSLVADHLKQGGFYQRQCSIVNTIFGPSLFLGMTGVADMSKIWISDDPLFYPEDHRELLQGLVPLTDQPNPDRHEIRRFMKVLEARKASRKPKQEDTF